MVPQDDSLAVAQCVRDPLALAAIEHDPVKSSNNAWSLVKRARILRHRFEKLRQRRKCLAVERVRMRGTDHIRPSGMHFRVDRERRRIHGQVTLDDSPVMGDEQQVARPRFSRTARRRGSPRSGRAAQDLEL